MKRHERHMNARMDARTALGAWCIRGCLVAGAAALTACGGVGDATSALTQALGGGANGGDHGGPGGPGAAPPAAPPPQCAPPVADGVTVAPPAPPPDAPPDGAPPGGGGAPPPRHDRGPRVLALIYDEDESHSLDDTERAKLAADLAAGCTARNAGLLQRFDADGSGVLEQSEWDAAVAAERAAHQADFAAVDTDGDGTLSSTEMDAARAAFLATWDSDGDGTLNADERATFRAAMQDLVRTGQDLPFIPPPPRQ